MFFFFLEEHSDAFMPNAYLYNVKISQAQKYILCTRISFQYKTQINVNCLLGIPFWFNLSVKAKENYTLNQINLWTIPIFLHKLS